MRRPAFDYLGAPKPVDVYIASNRLRARGERGPRPRIPTVHVDAAYYDRAPVAYNAPPAAHEPPGPREMPIPTMSEAASTRLVLKAFKTLERFVPLFELVAAGPRPYVPGVTTDSNGRTW